MKTLLTVILLLPAFTLAQNRRPLVEEFRLDGSNRFTHTVSSGETAIRDNTYARRRNCVKEIVNEILSMSSFNDLVVTSVRASRVYRIDHSYLFEAVDPSGNRFSGYLITVFDTFHEATVDPRSGRVSKISDKVTCSIPVYNLVQVEGSAALVLRNALEQEILIVSNRSYSLWP